MIAKKSGLAARRVMPGLRLLRDRGRFVTPRESSFGRTGPYSSDPRTATTPRVMDNPSVGEKRGPCPRPGPGLPANSAPPRVAAPGVPYAQAPAFNAAGGNGRGQYREYGNYRGPVVVGGEQVAWSEPVKDSFGYQRMYANGALYSAVTGFYSVVYGRTGIESTNNTVLNGSADSLFITRVQDLVTGKQQRGATVELTIDPAVQKAAADALGTQKGAVVALDPRTGAILAMVTSPSLDPTPPRRPGCSTSVTWSAPESAGSAARSRSAAPRRAGRRPAACVWSRSPAERCRRR